MVKRAYHDSRDSASKMQNLLRTTLRGRFSPKLYCRTSLMLAYELYTFNEKKGYEFIGVLPERRKNATRITKDSIMNWGKLLLGNNLDSKEMFFKQVAIDRLSGGIRWDDPSSDNKRVNVNEISEYPIPKKQRQQKKWLWFF